MNLITAEVIHKLLNYYHIVTYPSKISKYEYYLYNCFFN